MISIDLLSKLEKKYPALIQDFEFQKMYSDEYSRLLNIELYKLASRQTLIDELHSQGYSFIDCGETIEPEELSDRLYRILDGGYFVYRYTEEEITLVTDYFKEDINSNISAFFPDYVINIVYVTPLNYRELVDGEDVKYGLYAPSTFYKRIVYDAIENNASDIHIVNNISRDSKKKREYHIFYRLLNNFRVQSIFELNYEFNQKLIMDIVTNRTLGSVTDLNSADGVTTSWLNIFGDGTIDLRITCSKTTGQDGAFTCVARISKMATVGKSIDALGFDGRTQLFLNDLSNNTSGVTFITGAVRTGKNTTMLAVINSMLDRELKFIEFSSPIETIMPFEQLDYRNDSERLDNYINLVKKQDVDIAVLNELPNKDIAADVVDLVNSSIGVFTTFHINRLWHLPYKLKDYFGDSYIDLITQINGVVNQKMFVKQCSHCRYETSEKPNDERIVELMNKYDLKTYYKTRGCSKCNGTGRVNGVQPYAEYLYFTDEIKSELLKCSKPYEMEYVLRKYINKNHASLEYTLMSAIRQGDLSIDDLSKLF